MSKKVECTNAECAIKIRNWLKLAISTHHFSWPTDCCGYNQHVRYAKFRNAYWFGGSNADYRQFVSDYADMIEKEPDALEDR